MNISGTILQQSVKKPNFQHESETQNSKHWKTPDYKKAIIIDVKKIRLHEINKIPAQGR